MQLHGSTSAVATRVYEDLVTRIGKGPDASSTTVSLSVSLSSVKGDVTVLGDILEVV